MIVPGSKQTVDDLLWMKESGLDIALQEYAQTGLIVGICGGMQMLGKTISDPSEWSIADRFRALAYYLFELLCKRIR